MSKKSRKSVYIRDELVGDVDDASPPSRTALKKASTRRQEIGAELVQARASVLARLRLPEPLLGAIRDAKSMTSFGAKRRQLQFIGKQMRALDDETVEAIRAALSAEHGQAAKDVGILHRAEQWRDYLIADDERLGQWIEEFPGTDIQALRALIRQARKDARQAKPGETQRQGRAYRQIFALVRAQLSSAEQPT